MTYRKRTTIVAVVCIALAAVVAGAAINYANDDEFKNYVDGLTTTDADGDSYWDNLMPWDSDNSSDATAPSSGNNTPTGTTAGSQISTGDFVSGRNLTLYSSYVETNNHTCFGFKTNDVKESGYYRVRVTYPLSVESRIYVLNNTGDGDWHTFAFYNKVEKSVSGLNGYAVYDPDSKEVSVDFVIYHPKDYPVEIMLQFNDDVFLQPSSYQGYADGLLSGYSVSISKTNSPMSKCLCCAEAVG